MITLKRVCVFLVLACCFLITGAAGLVVAGVGYVLLAVPILVNEWSHRAYLKRLTAEEQDDDGYTSEEFGPRADWVGGILKSLPLLALMPAYALSADLARRRASKHRTGA